MVRVVDYDIAASVLTLNGISAVSASERIQRLNDRRRLSTVDISGSRSIQRKLSGVDQEPLAFPAPPEALSEAEAKN